MPNVTSTSWLQSSRDPPSTVAPSGDKSHRFPYSDPSPWNRVSALPSGFTVHVVTELKFPGAYISTTILPFLPGQAGCSDTTAVAPAPAVNAASTARIIPAVRATLNVLPFDT